MYKYTLCPEKSVCSIINNFDNFVIFDMNNPDRSGINSVYLLPFGITWVMPLMKTECASCIYILCSVIIEMSGFCYVKCVCMCADHFLGHTAEWYWYIPPADRSCEYDRNQVFTWQRDGWSCSTADPVTLSGMLVYVLPHRGHSQQFVLRCSWNPKAVSSPSGVQGESRLQ